MNFDLITPKQFIVESPASEFGQTLPVPAVMVEVSHPSDSVVGTEQLTSDCTTGKEAACPPWRIFVSTFATVFLAELGDKTQISTLLMSAEFHNPWVVFLGAGSALITTTLLGVLIGQWLSKRLSPRTLDIAAGLILALIAVGLVWDVLQL